MENFKVTKSTTQDMLLNRDSQTSIASAIVIYQSGSKTFKATSSDAGLYQFKKLPPGTYDVEVSKKGYNKYKKASVHIGLVGELREIKLEKIILLARMIEVKFKPKKSGEIDLRRR